jgi:hypothetical protein
MVTALGAPAVQHHPIAVLGIGERVVAVPSLEAGIARLLAGLEAAEERRKSSIQAFEHILQDLGMDLSVLRADGLHLAQFPRLLLVAHRDPTPLPGRLALLQGGVVEATAAPQDSLQHLRLRGCRQQLVLEGLAPRDLGHHRLLYGGIIPPMRIPGTQ